MNPGDDLMMLNDAMVIPRRIGKIKICVRRTKIVKMSSTSLKFTTTESQILTWPNILVIVLNLNLICCF